MNMMNQANNIAAQGRYGDTMLMHVNPNEVKGLAQLGALSLNPSTGLPEAFKLKDLIPMIASIAGGAFFGPMGAALGSGLSTAAVEGDLKKGLFAGLSSYALGSLLNQSKIAAAGDVAADAATQSALQDTAISLGVDNPGITTGLTQSGDFAVNAINPDVAAQMGSKGVQEGIAAARTGGMEVAKLAQSAPGADPNIFAGMQDVNLSNVVSAAADPSVYIPGAIGLGGTGVIQSQEEYQDMLDQLAFDEEERKRQMYLDYPEAIPGTYVTPLPSASGGQLKYQEGGMTEALINYDFLEALNNLNNTSSSLPVNYGAGMEYVPERQANPIPAGFVPGFMPEFNYFSNSNPPASDLQSGIDASISNLGASDVSSAPVFSPTQSPGYQQFYGSAAQGVPQVVDPTQAMQPFQVGPFVPPPPAEMPIPNPPGRPSLPEPITPPPEPVPMPPGGGMLPGDRPPTQPFSPIMDDLLGQIEGNNEPILSSVSDMQNLGFPVFNPESLQEQISRNAMIVDMLEKDERRISPMNMGKGGGTTFPDLNKDGEITKADILKGRGVFQAGGLTEILEDPITQDVIAFILGDTNDESALNIFIDKYGPELFQELRRAVLQGIVPNAQVEGQIQGTNQGGMADDINGMIGNKQPVAVSQDEFIVPADVVSMLGDGSSDAGSEQLYNMMDRVRKVKTGGTTQASPINPNKVLPA